jgi:hypothetical protein
MRDVNLKIAVVAHCHYADVADLILERLSASPVKFDFFVTTSDESLAEILSSRLENLTKFDACQIVIGPNRGRNFAQFLIEFRKELSQYDLICHVHTKKSLQRSDKLHDWGAYLIENLIGSPELWAATIELFNNDRECGLAYPETFELLPFWSEHWLGNFDIAQHWAQQHRLYLSPGFVHYPVGGMFWARPAAIAQLLEHDWSYEIFPTEESQLDGTMHHAVERLVGAVCALNGYRQHAYDPRRKVYSQLHDRQFRTDPNFSAGRIAEYISRTDCVSFDLFSLTTHTKRETEEFALARVAEDLVRLRLVSSATDYTLRRQLAELRSRFDHRHVGNIGLDEIVASLAVELNINDSLTLKHEADYARDYLEPDLRLGSIYKAATLAGKKIALIAECVYDQAWMESIVGKFSLPEPDYYFSTSQTRGLCVTGSIWNDIFLKTKCADWSILHFGKDIHCDYLLPYENKVMAIHVPQYSVAQTSPK